MTQKIIDAKRAEIETKKELLGKMQYRLWAMSHDTRRDDSGEKYHQASPCTRRHLEESIFELCQEIYEIELDVDGIQHEIDAQ